MGMLEDSGLLRSCWYVAAQASELGQKKPIRRVLFEQPLVLWRDHEGCPVALLDRCAHRNAPLSQGAVHGAVISCPYHGWAYDQAGRCVHVPSDGPQRDARAGNSVAAFATLERYGLIYVWMGPNAPDREPFPMPKWREQGWGHYYMYTEFQNDVTNLVENFMDVPHTVFVHESWFRSARSMRVGMEVERTDDSVLVTYDQPNDSIGFAEWATNPRGLPMVHTDKFFMPNVTRVDYVYGEEDRAFLITSTCTPIGLYRTAVYTLISYKFGWLNPLLRMVLPAYTRKVIQQDVWIMEVQGKNLQTFGSSDFHSTAADTLHRYIESLRDHAAAGGTGAPPEPRTKNGAFWI